MIIWYETGHMCPHFTLTSGCWLNSWPTNEDPLRVVARMRMWVLLLALKGGRETEGEEGVGEGISSQPWSEASSVSWPSRVRSLRLQLTAWPVGARPTEQSRLKGLVEKVRMAVYWMAMEANASSTTDFQEHCMVAGQMHQEATALSARQEVKDRKTQGGQETKRY